MCQKGKLRNFLFFTRHPTPSTHWHLHLPSGPCTHAHTRTHEHTHTHTHTSAERAKHPGHPPTLQVPGTLVRIRVILSRDKRSPNLTNIASVVLSVYLRCLHVPNCESGHRTQDLTNIDSVVGVEPGQNALARGNESGQMSRMR